jgi:hypothetical protein
MLKTIVISILLAVLVWNGMNWISGRPSSDNGNEQVVENKGYNNAKGQIVDNQGLVIIDNLMYLTPGDSDAAICSTLVDPASLPKEHYNTQSGFDACVARCLNFTTRQVCSQFPQGSHILATQPVEFQKMVDRCHEDIQSFVTRGISCGYLNCVP